MSILILIMGRSRSFARPRTFFQHQYSSRQHHLNYNGLVPEDMSDRIVSITERALTTTVDNIEHIESQSLYGIAVVKVFLQPTRTFNRHCTNYGGFSDPTQQLPAGSTPPLILAYSASSVPVLQLALSGQNLSEQELNDYGLNSFGRSSSPCLAHLCPILWR